jgi:hypothetical protein
VTVTLLWLGDYLLFDTENNPMSIKPLATLSIAMVVYAAISQLLLSK